MSAQIPLTREALFTWASVDDASITCRLAQSALAYMHTLDAVIVERNEAYRQRDGYELQIIDARAILGAAAGDLLSDAAERAACAVQHEANAMDIIGRALGRKVVGGADVAAIHASEEIDRLREQVKALVGAERERDRLLRSEADACKILGAAPDELLSDAARRESEPPQVFAIRHTVKVETDHGLTYAEVDIGRITDPAFLALPMGVRLGLVVCDG